MWSYLTRSLALTSREESKEKKEKSEMGRIFRKEEDDDENEAFSRVVTTEQDDDDDFLRGSFSLSLPISHCSASEF